MNWGQLTKGFEEVVDRGREEVCRVSQNSYNSVCDNAGDYLKPIQTVSEVNIDTGAVANAFSSIPMPSPGEKTVNNSTTNVVHNNYNDNKQEFLVENSKNVVLNANSTTNLNDINMTNKIEGKRNNLALTDGTELENKNEEMAVIEENLETLQLEDANGTDDAHHYGLLVAKMLRQIKTSKERRQAFSQISDIIENLVERVAFEH